MFDKKSKAILGICWVGFVFSAPVLAQTTDQSSGAASSSLEEITVTAQRRAENSQSVPISISVITAKASRELGIDDTSSLEAAVPGLEFTRSLNNATPALRGVGTNPAAPAGDESAVAMYVDGVYISSPAAVIFAFNNIDRIEVLKGPQGTLFGRNATGGVIQVITKDPTQAPSVDFDVGYGNYNTVTTNLYTTSGITPVVAADLAVHYENEMAGWGRDLFTGQDAFTEYQGAVRTKWLFTPDDDTKITLSGDYDRGKTSEGVAFHPVPGALFLDGQTRYMGFNNINSNPISYTDTYQYGTALKIDHDFSWAKLASITGYRQGSSYVEYDVDQTPLPLENVAINSTDQTYTQELQLLSPTTSSVQWIGGLYYFHDLAKYDPLAITGLALAPLTGIDIHNAQSSTSYAGFGQATATVLLDTRLTLGLRYTVDHRHAYGYEGSNFGNLAAGDNSVDYPKTTYRVALDHNFSAEVMSYFSYSTGFKSGVFNLVAPGSAPVQPETLDAYEIGLKNNLLDGRFRLNAALYYYKFHNLQVSILKNASTALENAAASESKGVDVDFEAAPYKNFRLRGAISWLDSTFTSFPDALITSPNPAGGNFETIGSATGNQTPRSPKWTANLSGHYVIGDYSANLSYYCNDGFYWDPDNRLRNPTYHLVNSSVDWTSHDRRWNLRLWGKNLLKQKYYSYESAAAVGDEGSPAPPLTFGFTFGAHWR